MYYAKNLIARNLLYRMKFGGTPPDDLDIRTVSNIYVNFVDRDLFLEGSEWSQETDAGTFTAQRGSLTCYHHICAFHARAGTLHLFPCCDCCYKHGSLDTDDVVLIRVEGKDASEPLAVSPEDYALSLPFAKEYDRYWFLKEFLSLSEHQQQALRRFLTIPAAAACLFHYVTVLSARILDQGSLSRYDIVEAIDRDGTDGFLKDRDIELLLELCEFQTNSGHWHMLPALHRIVHGPEPVTDLLESGLAEASHLHAHLEMACDPYALQDLARKTVLLYDLDPPRCKRLLLELLYTDCSIDEETMAEISRIFFYKVPLKLQDAKKLMLIPPRSWEVLLDDLFSKVYHQMNRNSTEYTQALALAWIIENEDIDEALPAAEELILEGGDNKAAVLVGMKMLSLILWGDLRIPVRIQSPEAIFVKLHDFLIEPDIFYDTAAVLARDLIFHGEDPIALADPRVREVAMARLEQDDGICPLILLAALNHAFDKK